MDVRLSPGRGQLALAPQPVADGNRVNRLALPREGQHGGVDHPVPRAIEVVGAQAAGNQPGQRRAAQEHRTEHRLLCELVVRRHQRI